MKMQNACEAPEVGSRGAVASAPEFGQFGHAWYGYGYGGIVLLSLSRENVRD